MSKRRRMPGTDSTPQPMGPNGEPLCYWCKGQVKPPRQTFCSKECVHQWSLRTSGSYMRSNVFERDQGVCALCGLDTEALLRDLLKLFDACQKHAAHRMGGILFERFRNKSLWQADHIVPVVKGGGECGMENIRTLCWWCHMEETKKLRAELFGKKEDPEVSGRQPSLSLSSPDGV